MKSNLYSILQLELSRLSRVEIRDVGAFCIRNVVRQFGTLSSNANFCHMLFIIVNKENKKVDLTSAFDLN